MEAGKSRKKALALLGGLLVSLGMGVKALSDDISKAATGLDDAGRAAAGLDDAGRAFPILDDGARAAGDIVGRGGPQNAQEVQVLWPSFFAQLSEDERTILRVAGKMGSVCLWDYVRIDMLLTGWQRGDPLPEPSREARQECIERAKTAFRAR